MTVNMDVLIDPCSRYFLEVFSGISSFSWESVTMVTYADLWQNMFCVTPGRGPGYIPWMYHYME